VALFDGPKKTLAHEVTQKLAAGHLTLLAFWALKHAGVLSAIEQQDEGLDPVAFARQVNISEPTLQALVAYLVQQDLLRVKKDRVFLTPACAAVLQYDDGVLEHLRAYEGVTQALEHLLAGLKVYGTKVHRRGDVWWQAQSQRYAAEVYPALISAAIKQGATHVLDLGCGGGTLLVELARRAAKVVGVGICDDGMLVRQANDAITAAGLDKRLLAVGANAVEVCANPRLALERVSVSQQLWEQFNCLIACGVFTPTARHDAPGLVEALARIAENFPAATLLLAEPCAGARFAKTFYAPEMTLLQGLSNSPLLEVAEWRALLRQARLPVLQEVPLATEGVTLFICKGKPGVV